MVLPGTELEPKYAFLCEYEKYSDQWYLALYLRYGSVNAVFDNFDHTLPISEADYHRKVRKAGIIKGDGRAESSLAQSLYVFASKALEPRLPLERICKNLPISVRAAKDFPGRPTIHRIYKSIVTNKPRRTAVGLIMTPEGDSSSILVADEKFTRRQTAKKSGETTIPIGFASQNQPISHSILRVLQREFSTSLALTGELTLGPDKRPQRLAKTLISSAVPFLEFHILDIRMVIAHITFPVDIDIQGSCNSFNVENHRLVPLSHLEVYENLRLGVGEILRAYKDYVCSGYSPKVEVANINKSLQLQIPALLTS